MSTTGQSKWLSFVLRHAPESIGLRLDAQGWARVDDLLEKAELAGQSLDRPTLLDIVRTSDKKRFTLSDDRALIRAAQGHSVAVDLGLSPAEPPEVLWHGTAEKSVAAILAEGLKPGKRRHVHLSLDAATARRVGERHGRPVLFLVHVGCMRTAGHEFFRADNGVWLTEAVPPKFLEREAE